MRPHEEGAVSFLAGLVAVVFRAQALKDVVQKRVFAYLTPREYMVNVFSCRYLALA